MQAAATTTDDFTFVAFGIAINCLPRLLLFDFPIKSILTSRNFLCFATELAYNYATTRASFTCCKDCKDYLVATADECFNFPSLHLHAACLLLCLILHPKHHS